MEPMKIDKLNSLFMCQFCKNTFKEPVILPCFEIICKCDLDKVRTSTNRQEIDCPFCFKTHLEPAQGFQVEKRMKELLDLEVNKLDFGKTFNNGKRLLKGLEEQINEFDQLVYNPEEFITSYFEEIRGKAQKKRESLLNCINEHFESILAELNECEKICKENLKKYEDLKNDINITRKYLNAWSRDYDSMRLNEEKRDDIISKSFQAKQELDLKLNQLKQDILLNLTYKFKIDDSKLEDKSIFGSVVKSFRFTFENFCHFKEHSQIILESEKYLINGYKWNIELKHKLGGFMGCYLYCDSKDIEKAILNVDHEFVLVNLTSPELSHRVELTNKFNLNENEEFVFGYGDSRFKLFQVKYI